MKLYPFLFALLTPTVAFPLDAGPSADDLALFATADVVIIGETHDNPAHHDVQAQIVAALQPAALVLEMLTPEQVAALTKDLPGYGAAWKEAGWPDYKMYLPIFTASNAEIFGAAVPRDVARASYTDGVAAHFDGDVALFGLDQPLPTDQYDQRLDLQFFAHCEAMPRIALGGMIEVQRLRDATLAKAAVDALDQVGKPMVIITGNGHARTDWGVPAMLRLARSELVIISVGQAEDGNAPEGTFDLVYDAPSVDRPDPCDAFK
ncbi:ChaN family lipoprotein [Aliiroseovarius sp. Z3]|uniref:ChaN family lipoprotein n=1 Tax=Aliiroseovarius sp. Z3 TaxID=2811402 RepID=UPI0023B3488B|nr:ChaN family lipoprotein [Aliiroseovarius sp. Z3]MDE9451266.1 ChaN family lipoprotein [Aliiroseovarius sp. Z3]